MQRRSNIYIRMYAVVATVVLCFFAHNVFEAVNYDVWNVNETIRIGQTSFLVKDFFPFFDPPAADIYGNPTRLDIQIYTYKLGFKSMCLAFSLGLFWLSQALNIFLSELPGRAFVRLPYLLLVLIGLFTFELLDFLFFYGQTDWKLQAILVGAALSYVIFFMKDHAKD